MRNVTLYIACSLDGFIARTDGRVDWLFHDADYGYTEFLLTIGTIIMGRKTYDQLLTFGEYPYTETEVYVVSRSRAGQNDGRVPFVGPEEMVEKVRALKTGRKSGIWLVGGAQLVQLFLSERLVDEIVLSIHPILLGAGIPLFLEQPGETPLEFIESRHFPSGLVQLWYLVKNTP